MVEGPFVCAIAVVLVECVAGNDDGCGGSDVSVGGIGCLLLLLSAASLTCCADAVGVEDEDCSTIG
jgi:hypothetical protein